MRKSPSLIRYLADRHQVMPVLIQAINKLGVLFAVALPEFHTTAQTSSVRRNTN